MKHVARIDIYQLDQPGYKAEIHKPGEDAVDLVEIYADKIPTFFVRLKDAVKALLGWE